MILCLSEQGSRSSHYSRLTGKLFACQSEINLAKMSEDLIQWGITKYLSK